MIAPQRPAWRHAIRRVCGAVLDQLLSPTVPAPPCLAEELYYPP